MNVLTSLETIAEKLEEKRKFELEAILKVSGSAAITRNEYGINVVDENNVASSLTFKTLVKPKYDEVEIKKAINIEIKELKPDIPKPNLELVPKPLYDSEVNTNADLRKENEDLRKRVENLKQKVAELEVNLKSEIDNRLTIEQTNDALVNQLNILTKTIDDFIIQIQTALQKSVEEGILRASLQSQNTGFKAQIQALIKQIDSLNSIIEGLQSQLGAVQNQQAITQGTQAQAQAAGADVINEVAIVKLEPEEDTNVSKIFARFKSGGGSQWKNGKSLTITNNDKKEITVKLTKTNPNGGRDFYSIPSTSFTMAPGENKSIEFTLTENTVNDLDARKKGGLFGGHTGSKDYKGGSLKVTITRADGTSKEKNYDSGFGKYHPNSY